MTYTKKSLLALLGGLALSVVGSPAQADEANYRIETCGPAYSVKQDGDCNVRPTNDPLKVEIVGLTKEQKAGGQYSTDNTSNWPALRYVTLPAPYTAAVDNFDGGVKVFWRSK